MGSDKHTVKVRYNPYHHNWVASVNLRPYDADHEHTCKFHIFQTKPTARQLRALNKRGAL